MCFCIPKGFKLIALGERFLRRPRRIGENISDLKGSNRARNCDPFQGQTLAFRLSVGVAQRSTTAINLDPSGMMCRNSN